MNAVNAVKSSDKRNWSDADYRDALNKLRHAWEYLNGQTPSSDFERAHGDAEGILAVAWQTLNETFSDELLWRSLPRGEDR